MDAMRQLVSFFDAVSGDQRISTRHISLYMALFRAWLKNDCQNPVSLERVSVMADAKISARWTFNKCLLELHEYGYLKYEPSFNCSVRSQVLIVRDIPGAEIIEEKGSRASRIRKGPRFQRTAGGNETRS